MLICSFTGEKLNPLVVGKSKNPRALKKISWEDLGVEYTYSKRVWMTSELFKRFLIRLKSKMLCKERKILLILDNAPSHSEVSHSNVELLFLPKNTTSIIQPLDIGVIKAFKSHHFNALINS
ncbi:Tigger transposable element-derived protein 6 [Dictyocoela muelleri]|nr:Tigger transposable element-derived protein 6 [Dictyocoela muelleri]